MARFMFQLLGTKLLKNYLFQVEFLLHANSCENTCFYARSNSLGGNPAPVESKIKIAEIIKIKQFIVNVE